MTDTIVAVLQLPAPIEASLVLDGGESIDAQVVAPPVPIVAAITLGGLPGPPGASGGGAVTFPFLTPAATWTITHGLGTYPTVQLLDTTGEQFDADIEYPDVNTVVVTLSQPTAGYAIIG